METASTLLRFVSRKGLYIIITGMAAVIVWLGGARVKAVEATAGEAKTIAEDAQSKAGQASRDAARVEVAIREAREARAIIEEVRRDQLEFYRWQAQQAGDWHLERKYRDRLRELPSQPR